MPRSDAGDKKPTLTILVGVKKSNFTERAVTTDLVRRAVALASSVVPGTRVPRNCSRSSVLFRALISSIQVTLQEANRYETHAEAACDTHGNHRYSTGFPSMQKPFLLVPVGTTTATSTYRRAAFLHQA